MMPPLPPDVEPVTHEDAMTHTEIPDTPDGPNHSLPALNPLKARSTLAAILSFLALVAPLIGGGIGRLVAEVVANGEQIQSYADQAVVAINVLLGIVSLVWLWIERRAPHRRLSFRRH